MKSLKFAARELNFLGISSIYTYRRMSMSHVQKLFSDKQDLTIACKYAENFHCPVHSATAMGQNYCLISACFYISAINVWSVKLIAIMFVLGSSKICSSLFVIFFFFQKKANGKIKSDHAGPKELRKSFHEYKIIFIMIWIYCYCRKHGFVI